MKRTKRLFGIVATVQDIPANLTCYRRFTGTNHLGEIPKSKCNMTYEENIMFYNKKEEFVLLER